MSISLSDAFEPYSIDSELNSNLELSKLADIISSFSTIKFELSVFVTLLISAALMLPIKKKNINTTETNNAVFLIEIFTPSWFLTMTFLLKKSQMTIIFHNEWINIYLFIYINVITTLILKIIGNTYF
jgi:hypothetical protein